MATHAENGRPAGFGTVVLLDPTAKANPIQKEMAQRTGQLGGKTVALIDNTKPNAGSFLDRIGELLTQGRLEVSLLKVRKQTSTGPADFLGDLRSRCDLAITAFGD